MSVSAKTKHFSHFYCVVEKVLSLHNKNNNNNRTDWAKCIGNIRVGEVLKTSNQAAGSKS